LADHLLITTYFTLVLADIESIRTSMVRIVAVTIAGSHSQFFIPARI
jgi:hypothetical protein